MYIPSSLLIFKHPSITPKNHKNKTCITQPNNIKLKKTFHHMFPQFPPSSSTKKTWKPARLHRFHTISIVVGHTAVGPFHRTFYKRQWELKSLPKRLPTPGAKKYIITFFSTVKSYGGIINHHDFLSKMSVFLNKVRCGRCGRRISKKLSGV